MTFIKIQKLNISNLIIFSRFSWDREKVNLAIVFTVLLVIQQMLTEALALRRSEGLLSACEGKLGLVMQN